MSPSTCSLSSAWPSPPAPAALHAALTHTRQCTALSCYSASTGWHLSPPLSTRDSSLACQLTAPGLHRITSPNTVPHTSCTGQPHMASAGLRQHTCHGALQAGHSRGNHVLAAAHAGAPATAAAVLVEQGRHCSVQLWAHGTPACGPPPAARCTPGSTASHIPRACQPPAHPTPSVLVARGPHVRGLDQVV